MSVKSVSRTVFALVALGASVGCGRVPLDGGWGDAGPGPTPPACNTLDETTCKGRSDCTALSCSDCAGGQTFAGCAAPGGAGVACGPCPPRCDGLDETSCKASSSCHPGYCAACDGGQTFTSCLGPDETVACRKSVCPTMPAPCSGLAEASCLARSDCQAGYCNWCQQRTFVGCGDPGTAFGCPTGGPACPAVVPCAKVTDRLSCDARTDCHSVFVNNAPLCNCTTPGCCFQFSSCADGGKAACNGPIGPGAPCMIPPPTCAPPGYVVSFAAICYEGCVPLSECGP